MAPITCMLYSFFLHFYILPRKTSDLECFLGGGLVRGGGFAVTVTNTYNGVAASLATRAGLTGLAKGHTIHVRHRDLLGRSQSPRGLPRI